MVLVNTGDGELLARETATALGLQQPVLLDADEALYNQYLRPLGDGYAPFPLHVLIRPDGTVGYVRTQWDFGAATAAIDAALE